MESSPNYDQRIIEALEVCRPGSDDVADPALRVLADAIEADPELAQLYARLQEVDGRVAAAFADVPVPEGLEGRLLERLSVASESGVSAGEDAGRGSEQPPGIMTATDSATPGLQAETTLQPAPVAPQRARRTRRWLLVGGGVAAAAALVVGAMIVFSDRGRVYTAQEVRHRAIEFFHDESPEAGRPDDPPADYPLSSAVGRPQRFRIGWRRVSGLLDSRGVAYDFRGPRGVRATLYVLDQQVAELPTAPTLSPHTTGGCSVEAWQEGELLYVLVVNSGNRATYQQFFHPPGRLT